MARGKLNGEKTVHERHEVIGGASPSIHPIGTKSTATTAKTLRITAAERIKALEGVDINKMTGPELYEAVRAAQKVVNRRYKEVLKKVGPTPATRGLEEHGGLITTKGMRAKQSDGTYRYNINKLRHQLVTARNYFRATTGTVKGARKYIDKLDVKIPGYKEYSEEERSLLWDLVDRFKKERAWLWEYFGASRVIQNANEIIRGDPLASIDDLFGRLTKKMESKYERARKIRKIRSVLSGPESV